MKEILRELEQLVLEMKDEKGTDIWKRSHA